ncbi:MAG TPA: hypothetical protein VHA34_19920 [Actinomycetes bacterium]|nr:hypothetical protein [Actinomycetes bacterium]
MTERWGLLVRQGSEALREGRFDECERLAAEAARMAPSEAAPALLTVAAYREKGRLAEAEVLARCVLSEHGANPDAHALLGAVLADVGRDAEARRHLDVLAAEGWSPTATVLAAEIAAALDSPAHAEPLRAPLTERAEDVVGWHGSLARHVGLVCHVLGLWGEAERRFEAALRANKAAGAPVAVAHTCRQLSALLRARGDEGDWDRAIDLLSHAAAIYRRLEIERLAEQADAVLRRSQEQSASDAGLPVVNVFRRTASGWELEYDGHRVVAPDIPGLGHIATLVASEGRPVHAVDLVETDQAEATYRARLAELEGQLTAPDPVTAALARAERDFLRAELAVVAAGRPPAADVGDRARRLAALRIRTCLDALDDVLPALARHLRRSIRTGIFCLYEPQQPERWNMGRSG